MTRFPLDIERAEDVIPTSIPIRGRDLTVTFIYWYGDFAVYTGLEGPDRAVDALQWDELVAYLNRLDEAVNRETGFTLDSEIGITKDYRDGSLVPAHTGPVTVGVPQVGWTAGDARPIDQPHDRLPLDAADSLARLLTALFQASETAWADGSLSEAQIEICYAAERTIEAELTSDPGMDALLIEHDVGALCAPWLHRLTRELARLLGARASALLRLAVARPSAHQRLAARTFLTDVFGRPIT